MTWLLIWPAVVIGAVCWVAHGFLLRRLASRGLGVLSVIWQLTVGGLLLVVVLTYPSWVFWLTLGVTVVVEVAYMQVMFRELMREP